MSKVRDGFRGKPLNALSFPMPAPRTVYKVSRFDNLHSGGGEEDGDLVGEFILPGAALWAARNIVRQSLGYLLSQRFCRRQFDTTADELVSDWYDFGDSAFISPPAGEGPVRFTSSAYARELAKTLCTGED